MQAIAQDEIAELHQTALLPSAGILADFSVSLITGLQQRVDEAEAGTDKALQQAAVAENKAAAAGQKAAAADQLREAAQTAHDKLLEQHRQLEESKLVQQQEFVVRENEQRVELEDQMQQAKAQVSSKLQMAPQLPPHLLMQPLPHP